MNAAPLEGEPVAPELDPDQQELAGAVMAGGRAIITAGYQATQVYTALVPTETEPVVRLQFCTDSGVFVVCVSQDVARKIGVDLQKKGSTKKLAIVTGTK